MKILRLKITDSKGFRSLQKGFEYRFRSEWDLQEESGFSPFVCAGRNGSGKSNLLEVLAAIFYHLECIQLTNLPDSFEYEKQKNPNGFRSTQAIPNGFEIEYLIQTPIELESDKEQVRIKIIKQIKKAPDWSYWNRNLDDWESLDNWPVSTPIKVLRRSLLPRYVVGYSSGENEILSLPFFKMRFIQFDEYWELLKQKSSDFGEPESRMLYLDSGFSQAILLCNLLLQKEDTLSSFCEDIGIESLREFRIVIKRGFELNRSELQAFRNQDDSKQQSDEELIENHQALSLAENDPENERFRVNIVNLLDDDSEADNGDTLYRKHSDKVISRFKRCATCWFLDEANDTLYLDYYVNEATKQAFRENFDFETERSPIPLFQAFQVLLTLNLYSVSDSLKADLYQSNSLYVSETVPTLASDERIIRFENVQIKKTNVSEPVLLKSLSDGEHQLLHTLGLCLLFKNTNSLFLLDEPETHFNPDWRAKFITRLYQSLGEADSQEMLITTHTPFLISDSKPDKVLVFNKEKGKVSINHPNYNTLGASINKITMDTFGKRETIGDRAQEMLREFKDRSANAEENKEDLIAEINNQLGDSVEKMLLVKTILDSMEIQE